MPPVPYVRLALVLGVLVVARTGARAADVPPGTEVLRVDRVPGKFGAVRFTHGEHNASYRHPGGARIRCRDCHHTLAGDEPTADERARMRCSGCHVSVDEPPRSVAGRVAPPLATLKPDGAVDYRSILFHAYCWACHRKIQKDGHQHARCKLCHERGVGDDTIRGRYDAALQPGTALSWLRCPAGQRLTGGGCEGQVRPLARDAAEDACPEGYRLPTRAELLGLLAGCDERRGGGRRARCGCAGSAACAGLFGPDQGEYWAADGEGGRSWVVRLGDGETALRAPAAATPVRCVRTAER